MHEIAIVTDSSSQIRDPLAATLGVEVVAVTVTIDGDEHLDGEPEIVGESGLGVDDFYRRFVEGESTISTSQPPPVAFIDAFGRAIEQGASEIVAVLVGSAYSGTVDSCRLAAGTVDVPVHIVDTGHASFGIGSCVLAAAARRSAGGTVADIVASAEARASEVETVFLLQGLELARRSGRFDAVGEIFDQRSEQPGTSDDAEGIPVLWMGNSDFQSLGEVVSLSDAVDVMARRILGAGHQVQVAVSVAHPETEAFADMLEARLADSPHLAGLIRYKVGASVAAHSGVGSAGAYYWKDNVPGHHS